MVVGTTPYRDRKEAYPLDKKTLRKTAFRSFFMHGSRNGETRDAIGWTWAMAPALKKIHTDEDDLATSLGQNLEFNDSSHFFCTLVMGVSLSMEAQKCDPAEIRSVRTSLGLACRSLEKALVFGLLTPWLLTLMSGMINNGSMAVPVIYGAVLLVLNLIMRFVLINVGYKQGSRIFEKISHEGERLKQACTIWGVFSIGAFLALPVFQQFSYSLSSTSYYTEGAFGTALLGLGITLLLHHLLTRKNWTLGKCAGLVIVFALVLGFVTAL
jgi:PTS system N-acetylgalactosamine-specific IID component